MSDKKHKLGQFMTTNYEYIFQGMTIPNNITNIIEPFTGNGDLLKFLKKDYKIECYDIDPKKDFIIKRDTINNPPSYKEKFIITNPPFLARNKSKNKLLFDKYNVNDLYKCFIKELLTNFCNGGIIITPINFWSSIRQSDVNLRKKFMSYYEIIRINIFEENVFDDTTYSICSFQFQFNEKNNNNLDIFIYPENINIKTNLNRKNNYIIGGDIYNLKIKNIYNVSRLTKNNTKNTNLLIKCIDDNKKNQIKLSFVSNEEIYIDETPKLSSRTYATLVIEPVISEDQQKKLVQKFNDFLENHRNKYHSLFLTNYRESARKRISFDLIYQITEHILENFFQ
jgi:hypothetical protein